jgi:adenylate cyclase
MVKFLRQHSRWIIAGFGFLVFGLAQTEWLTSSVLWQKAEGALIDRRYLLRGERPSDPDIILVGLETSSFKLDALAPEEIAASPALQLMRHPWPWDRRVYAAMLEKLMDAGAKVVVFDFVFASQTDGDDEFARALQKYKDRVVVGEMFADEEGANHEKIKKLTTPNDDLLSSGTESVVGLVNLWPDPDGIVRHGKYHTSIEREAGLSGFPDNLTHIAVMTLEKFEGKTIELPASRESYIDFQGRAGTCAPLPVEEMFVDKLWNGGGKGFNGGMIFSNKIVVVGPMAEIFHDIHTTPFGDTTGPEIQAQIMAALLHGSWLSGTSPLVNLALALGLLWLGLELCLRINNALLKVALLAAAAVIYFIVCQIAFSRYKLVLPMMPPLFCLAVPGAFGVVFQYALEQFERIRTRSLLERYVSKNVAKTILEDQRSFIESLSGRKQAVTVLFSDIRGFTSMTESSDAETLVAQLNEYFLEMVGVVLKEGGTLQKFIGDALMAAWGDTHSEGLAEDAQRAARAALEMRAALAKLNERWATQPDRAKLKIGVGVNHGEIIVGNIGHPQRMEFTVLGDGVNLASRLESATKQFHTDILVGETVEALTREKFIYRNVGAIAFKGKTKPIEVFTLLSDRSQPAPAWLAKYHEGIRLYRDRQFAAAIGRFQEAEHEIGGEDFLCHMYIGHGKTCLQQAPPPDWDGSFTLTEK